MAYKVKIAETGRITTLEIIDPNTGVDWIADMIGNADQDYEYDENDDTTIMTQDAYDWWIEYIADYIADEAEIEALLEALAEKYGWPKADMIMEKFYDDLAPYCYDDEHIRKQETLKKYRELYETEGA